MRRWNDSAFSFSQAVRGPLIVSGRMCLVALTVMLPACGRRSEELPVKALPESAASQAAAVATAGTSHDKALEPFDPPPLASLNGDSTWIDRPVRDGLAIMREQQAKEPAPGPVAEALALRNTSPAINRQILSTLGRLPGDGAADLSARIDRHVAGDLGSTNPIMISTSADFDQ